jgi:hypothetical protein
MRKLLAFVLLTAGALRACDPPKIAFIIGQKQFVNPVSTLGDSTIPPTTVFVISNDGYYRLTVSADIESAVVGCAPKVIAFITLGNLSSGEVFADGNDFRSSPFPASTVIAFRAKAGLQVGSKMGVFPTCDLASTTSVTYTLEQL